MIFAVLMAIPAPVHGTCFSQVAQPLPTIVSSQQLPELQAELGITAISLTLGGFSQTEIASIRESLLQQPAASMFLTARASAAGYERQIGALRESADGQLDRDCPELQELTVALTTSRAAAAIAREQLLVALPIAVPSSGWEVIRRVREAPAGVPAPMRILNWSRSELELLAKAVFEERKAIANQSQMAEADAALLHSARANAAVVAAELRLVLSLDEVTSALRGNVN